MTDEVRAGAAESRPASNEERHSDPHGLYRMWFDRSEEKREGPPSPAEFVEQWRQWFEATSGTSHPETYNAFLENLTTLWLQMAEDISAEMFSEGEIPEDPLRFFLRWYEAKGEKWSETADEFLKDDEVLQALSRSLHDYARSHREVHRASEEGLRRLQFPTRTDITRVATLVRTVEDKVDRIEEVFEEFVYGDSEPATAAAIGDLEERIDRLESKMDRMLAILENFQSTEVQGARASEAETPLEGLSLIEAGHIGAGGWEVVEDLKTPQEEH